MNEEMKIIIKAVTDGAKKSIKGVSDELNKLGKTGSSSSGKVGMALKGIGKAAGIAVAAIAAVGAALVALGKGTLQVQREQAKLNTAFQAAGSTAKQAGETYKGLYRFLGDSGKASEAAAHLAKITTNQQDLAQWTKITQGIYSSFGDSLPIEGLTEAANETIRVGKVTGTLADALNWAGVSEDEMNAKLATTNSLQEREAMLRSTLNGLYENAANIYEKNNQQLIAYNESQARLDTTMAAAGAATMPLLTALNNLGSAFFTALKPALDAIIQPIATFINWIAKAIESVMSFFSALTGKSSNIKAVADVGSGLASAAGGAQKLASGLGSAGDAAGGAAKAIEEAKKSTQGFDELNIVSSGTSGSGGSGGGGGGSGSPGYGSGGAGGLTAAFGTEVEETEGQASGLVKSIKEAFAGLAEALEPSKKAWMEAFNTVKDSWNKSKPDYIHGCQEIKEAFATLGGYLWNDWIPEMTNSFSTNLAPMIGDVFGFIVEEGGKAFSWLGEKVNEQTKDLIIPALERIKTTSKDTFESMGKAWDEHGESLMKNLSKFAENMRKTFDGLYQNFLLPIWNKILQVFDWVWTNGLKPLVDKVVNAIMIIVNEITILYNEYLQPIVDWIIKYVVPVITSVVNFIIDVIGSVIVFIADVIGGIVDIIVGIVRFIVGIFTGDWEKAWQGVCDIFSGIWGIIEGIIDFVWNLIDDFCIFIVDIFKKAWELIKGAWANVKQWFIDLAHGIKDAFVAIADWFADLFRKAWEGIKSAWSAVVDWFAGIWDKIVGVFAGVKDWFANIFGQAWQAIKNVFSNFGSFFSGLWDKIKNTFSALGTKIGDAIGGAVKKGINGVLGMIEKVINKGIDLINGAIGLINKIPGVNVGKVGKLSIPRLAKGGIVDSATIAMIGEAGKEAVMPLENNTEWMDKLADKLAAKTSAPSKIVLMLDGKELGWANIHSINNITKQTGSLQLQLV